MLFIFIFLFGRIVQRTICIWLNSLKPLFGTPLMLTQQSQKSNMGKPVIYGPLSTKSHTSEQSKELMLRLNHRKVCRCTCQFSLEGLSDLVNSAQCVRFGSELFPKNLRFRSAVFHQPFGLGVSLLSDSVYCGATSLLTYFQPYFSCYGTYHRCSHPQRLLGLETKHLC